MAGNPGASDATNCISDQIEIFRTECNGQNSCTVPVTNWKFGSRCDGVYKYAGIILNLKFFFLNIISNII